MRPQLRKHYQDTVEFFSYVHCYAPDIPSTGGLTLDSALNRLFDNIDTLSQTERDATARQWLRLAWNEVKQARNAFNEQHNRQGQEHLEKGRTFLVNAQTKKSMTPSFVAGQPGLTE